MNKLDIIDAHSHIGIGINSRLATISEYEILRRKYNIVFSLLMPQPIINDTIIRNEKLFDTINDITFNKILDSNYCNISFVPMVSPIYVSSKKLEQYIYKYKPLAIKIHMKSDFSNPEMITKEWIKVIKKFNLPIIVHTDYSSYQIAEKDVLKNLNSSLKWFDFFIKNDIKGYLTHGARLNDEVLNKVNKFDNVVIGIGPDLLLQRYSENSLEQQGDYLEILYNNVDPNKLIFDLDYNWNINEYEELDYMALTRLKKYWNDEQYKKILSYNSKKFFWNK